MKRASEQRPDEEKGRSKVYCGQDENGAPNSGVQQPHPSSVELTRLDTTTAPVSRVQKKLDDMKQLKVLLEERLTPANRQATITGVGRVNIRVALGEGFRLWVDDSLLNGSRDGWASRFGESLTLLVRTILCGHLMDICTVEHDAPSLRVWEILKSHAMYRNLHKEALKKRQESGGVLTETVMDYVAGEFLHSIKEMIMHKGWTVVCRECDADFVGCVRELQGDTAWLKAASTTSCIRLNDPSHSDDRFFKSDINLYDVFQVIACDGEDVLVFNQKNSCSASIVAPVFSGRSKEYVFEIGAVFESENYEFAYLSNGLVCDLRYGLMRSIDNEYRVNNGSINVIHAATASRFRVPYAFVSRFIKEKKENNGYNAMTGDHCDINSSNHAVWNVRLVSISGEQSESIPENFRYQEDVDTEQVGKYVFAITMRHEVKWHDSRKREYLPVRSISEAAAVKRALKGISSPSKGNQAFKYSLNFAEWDPELTRPEVYNFQLMDGRSHEKVQWNVLDLFAECRRLNMNVSLKQLADLVAAGDSCTACKAFPRDSSSLYIIYSDSNYNLLNTLVLKPLKESRR